MNRTNNKHTMPPPWDSSITIEPGVSVYMDKDIANDYGKQKKALREIRGNVLAHTIEIEFSLDRLVTELFYPNVNNEQVKTTFNSIVFKQSRLSLSKKTEFLKHISKNLPEESDFKELIKNLNAISQARNDFAHNIIDFRPDTETKKLLPFVIHPDGQKEALDNAYFNKLNYLYSSTSTQIEAIIKKLTTPEIK